MKKKKKLANTIMVAVIAVIVAAGILFVGQYRGWFAHNENIAPAGCAVRDKGIIDLTRDGIASHMTDSVSLRDGDKLSSHKDAQATVQAGGGYLILGENASISADQAAIDRFAVTVLSGEVFVCAEDAVTVQFGEQVVVMKDSTAAISVRAGSESIGVLSGEISVGGKALSGGQTAAFAVNSDPTYTPLSAASLSDFLIQCALSSDKALCFTEKELTQVLTDRQAQKTISAGEATGPASTDGKTPSDTADGSTQIGSSPSGTPSAKPDKNDNTNSSTGTQTKDNTPASLTCTIEIRCDTILSNMENLDAGKDSYVPGNGVILGTTTVSFTEGETVFDVLKRACDQNGIPLEYSYTPLYESYYVEGINYLYEFDCGSESGWMYKVNGWFPNYGCSDYTLSQGDAIVWCYTCNGLGADVGGSVY